MGWLLSIGTLSIAVSIEVSLDNVASAETGGFLQLERRTEANGEVTGGAEGEGEGRANWV